jgi:beta-glucosidase
MPLGNYNGTPKHTITIGDELGKYQILSAGDGKTLVYCGGLSPQLEGEELPVEKEGFYKGDRTRIELPREQVEEIKAFKQQGYRIVLVLCTGSAIALEDVIDDCDAVLVAWYGGEKMGTAVKQLLFGERDDFGHLPVTFYRNSDQLPHFDDYNMQGRTYRYIDPDAALFPFGYGLSYSFYQLYETQVSEANFTVEGIISQCNTDVPEAPVHSTVVQVYLKNEADPEAPYKQLVGLAPVTFLKGEPTRKPFKIEMDPFWFRQFNPATGQMEEPADGTKLTLQVGFSSDDRDLFDFPFVYHNRK